MAAAIGNLGDLDQLPSALYERELAVRQCKPMCELVFSGDWNRPFFVWLLAERLLSFVAKTRLE